MSSLTSPNHSEVFHIKPTYQPSSSPDESPRIQSTIKALGLIPHVEGGYFTVTDASPVTIPSPYPAAPLSEATISATGGLRKDYDPSLRLMSTTIFYYLTPNRPKGSFHANRSRIIHTLHRGRGRYVLIHPDGRVESFIVGHDIGRGEKLQWIVEGGVWKASFLLDAEDQESNEGLLISETVVPGFEYADHEFLLRDRLQGLLPAETAAGLDWLINQGEHPSSMGKQLQQEETLRHDDGTSEGLNGGTKSIRNVDGVANL